MRFVKKTVEIAKNGTTSAGFSLEPGTKYQMALFPAMDDGNIGLELSIDDGDNYNPVLDPADGADVVLCASGSDPGWVDFSDFIRAFPQNDEYLIRFTCASQTTAAVTVTILQKDG